jgi:hypothetical protein
VNKFLTRGSKTPSSLLTTKQSSKQLLWEMGLIKDGPRSGHPFDSPDEKNL